MSHLNYRKQDTDKKRSFENEADAKRSTPRHAKMQAYKREKYNYYA